MALVSVVMPVYNASAFLKEAIESVLNQNFKNFEFILINDGSTDNSDAIIKSYKDKRIFYHYQQNAGVANALNKGISLASGKYIWRHDADDISLADKLEQQVHFIEKYPEFALVATQIAFMTESGKIAQKFRQPKNTFFERKNFVEVKREQFNPYSPITHATVLVRRDVVIGLGGFRKEFVTAEDVDLWLRLIQKHRAAVLYNCDYFVRLSKASVTKKHGWKNEFFRNLAFQYYDQRAQGGMDDLQKGIPPVLPAPSEVPLNSTTLPESKKKSEGLLGFLYPLYLNAGDWQAAYGAARLSLAQGWKYPSIWKLLLFPILGKRLVDIGVQLKRTIRKISM